MKNVKKNYNLILGGAITAVMLLLILTGFFWTPYDPESMEAANKFAGFPWHIPWDVIILEEIF